MEIILAVTQQRACCVCFLPVWTSCFPWWHQLG